MRELPRTIGFRTRVSGVGFLLAVALLWGGLFYGAFDSGVLADRNSMVVRKLLAAEVNKEVTERIGQSCSRDDIAVYQGETTPLPNGIPTFTVQILNMCISGCTVSNIHLSCGWFSSARTINPRVFRRIGYDDCLVNDGAPLGPGGSLSFQYANSYQYPLSVAYVRCY